VSLSIDIPVLETERLRLRGWREEDLDAYAAFISNEATARFLGGTGNRQNAWRRMAMLVGHWVLRGYGPWVIEEKSSGRWIGYSGLWNPEGWPEPEVMWGLAADRHGQGYATEAARRGREFAYRKLGWTTLTSYIDPRNAPSIRVAQRLGAAHERNIELGDHSVGLYRHPGPSTLNS
jgi:RimJ/RimL family protein N-acetyltransferase